MKKNILLHIDSLDVTDILTDEQCGKLLRMIKSYNLGVVYDPCDKIVVVAFQSFKNQFDRDNEKYATVCERNKNNIDKRRDTRNTSGKTGIIKNTRNTDKDKDKDSKNDKDNKKEKENIKEEYSLGWSDEMKESFEGFKQMRIKKNKPLTDYATRLIINKLRKLATSETGWIKLLDQSTTNNRTDIYELKDTGTKLTTEEIIKRNRDLTPKYSGNAITRLHEVTTGKKQIEDTGSGNDDW